MERTLAAIVAGTALAVPACPVLSAQPAAAETRPGAVQEVRAGARPRSPAPPPLFEGMGPHTRRVTTNSEEAQRYFDQGLNWTYAFNHDEAIRSFERAAELDPGMAMAHWGVALNCGPHINNPAMDEDRSRKAWEALRRAGERAEKASEVERALIAALAARYADPSAGPVPLTFEERRPLDRAYAEAMKRVYDRFPDDPDVAALYAEALMDLRPWDLWDSASGEPRPETPEVVAVLERVLEVDPDHPGANHLYVHAVEASNRPERANAAADRLRTLMPASGHMVHMPAHIDVRTGRWSKAAAQNRRAMEIDRAYRAISPRQGFYRLYMAHNPHFLSYACMMLGRSQEAIHAARAMISGVPPEFLETNAALVDAYAAIEIEALQRFGKWDELLELDPPPERLPITRAFWRFGRASALAAQGKVEEAEREREAFEQAVAAVPEGAMMAINPAHTVLSVAEHALAGEIAYRRGEMDKAVKELTRAVEIEDGLKYIEPPDWIQPVRHSLGAVLLEAGRVDEAERVYREDLARLPENGWALFGLTRCLEAKGSPEADSVRARFEKAWSEADTELTATCLCVTPDAD